MPARLASVQAAASLPVPDNEIKASAQGHPGGNNASIAFPDVTQVRVAIAKAAVTDADN